MAQRGRKGSKVPLSIVPPIDIRPEPPPDLSAEGKQIWRKIVDQHKPETFYACEFLLELHVRNILYGASSPPTCRTSIQVTRATNTLPRSISGKSRSSRRSPVRYA